MANVSSEDIEKVVIAYEPVWAIGTGKNAHPEDLEKARDTIRRQITSLYGEIAAKKVRLLYGGSVSVDNAADYLALSGVNGLLVGGASLKADVFAQIIKKASGQGRKK